MSMSDPIADMLTRIRNASAAHKTQVAMPASTIKSALATVLKQEGYIGDFAVQGDAAGRTLEIQLKYFKGAAVIEQIDRVSRPGCRIYANKSDLPVVRNGLGVALVSTSKGILTDKAARKLQLGGEVLCTVF